MKRLISIAGGLLLALTAVTASPGLGADTGTISATVSVAAPCISISWDAGKTGIDFGTRSFSTSTLMSGVGFSHYSIKNCGTGTESIAARGTKAHNVVTGIAQPVTWDLAATWPSGNICSAGINKYTVGVGQWNAAETAFLQNINLAETNAPFYSASAGAQSRIQTSMQLPCSGSDGAGAEMDFQVVFTASL